MARLILLCCVVLMPLFASSLKCYKLKCQGNESDCHTSSNNATILHCVPENDRCYKTEITLPNSVVELDLGCTQQESCDIQGKSCENSGDCTSTCCSEDRCNAEARASLPSTALLVTMTTAGLAFFL